MRRVLFPVASGLGVALALACGAPFSTATGGDASTSDSGSEAAQGSPPEAGGDGAPGSPPEAGGDGAPEAGGDDAPDAPPMDALDETPPHCAVGFECVPAVPPGGWSGPVEFYLGTAAPPVCPAAEKEVFDGMEGLQAPPYTCDCTCGSPCGDLDLTTSIVHGCATSCSARVVTSGACFTSTACTGSTLTGSYQTLSFGTSPACTPQPTSTPTPLSWQAYSRACAPALAAAQLDCPAGDVCTRKPDDAPFQAGVCIWQSGVLTCPVGYGQQHVEYTGDEDTRGCTSCTCGMTGAVTCSATLYTYGTTNDTCGGMATTYDPPVACIPTNAVADMKVIVTSEPSIPCAATGGTEEGTATPTGATTFCCTQ